MIIDPSLLLKIMPYIAAAAEKIKGKKTGLPEILQILPELTKAFKDPKIDETPDNQEEEVPEVPEVPKDTGLLSSGRYTSGIGNLLQIDPDKLNLWRPPIRSISPLSGINNLFESSW